MAPLICACWLTASLVSRHIDPDEMNQRNPGIGIEIAGYALGEFHNSVGHTSVYAARQFGVRRGAFAFGADLGAITGYQRHEVTTVSQQHLLVTPGTQPGTPVHAPYYVDVTVTRREIQAGTPGYVSPMLAPYLSWEGQRFGVNLLLMPSPGAWNRSAVGLQFKVRVGR